jgi:hypothetical protein
MERGGRDYEGGREQQRTRLNPRSTRVVVDDHGPDGAVQRLASARLQWDAQ